MSEFTPNFNFKIPDFNQRFWHDEMRQLLNGFDVLIAKYAALGNVIGVWVNSTAYNVGEVLIDENVGALYVCNTAHTSAPTGTFQDDRDLHPFYWDNATITNRFIGPWVSNYPYKTGDFVVSGSNYAVATQPFTSGATFADDEIAGRFYTLISIPAVAAPQLPTPGIATALFYARQNAAGTAYEVVALPAPVVGFDDPNVYASVVAGTGNAITLALPVPITSYVSGRVIRFLATATNSGAVTVDVDGLGIKTVQRNGVALASSLIVSGRWYELLYDGTNFQMRRYADITQIVPSDANTIWASTTGGTANALTMTPSIAITSYIAGMLFRFTASTTNTTAATIAVSGLAAINLRKNGVALVAGDVTTGKIYEIIYDGTNFNLREYAAPVTAGTGTRTLGTPLIINPYVASTATDGAHGLGVVPSGIMLFLECISTEHGYGVGDRIPYFQGVAAGSGTSSFTPYFDATNIGLRAGSVAPALMSKSASLAVNITPAKWKVIIVPFLETGVP